MGELGHVQKVTIVSRGTALGYTLHLPDEDRYLETKEELDRHAEDRARRAARPSRSSSGA